MSVIPVSGGVRFMRIFAGFPGERASNDSGVVENGNFQPISRRISKTVQDRTKVTIND